MKLATIANGHKDGALVVVSADGRRFLPAAEVAPNLLTALESWADVEPALRRLAARLEQGEGTVIDHTRLLAPLPRAWQWLDGSAFSSHGELMQKVLGIAPVSQAKPLMYQGLSHQFLSATEDVCLPSEADDIDFEGEFGVITDDVPMGTGADAALAHIKLIVQINDWSLRRLAGPEMKTGFGWIQAKPACSLAPFAATPDELGAAWQHGRVHLNLAIDWNDRRFGNAFGGVMDLGFHDLIAHAAATRDLCAGTIIGSGTVSNHNYREIGSSCIAERRGIEIIDRGAPVTGFMKFGERIKMEARQTDGTPLFGAIDQRVIKRHI